MSAYRMLGDMTGKTVSEFYIQEMKMRAYTVVHEVRIKFTDGTWMTIEVNQHEALSVTSWKGEPV